MEIDGVDTSREDYRGHFLAGALIASTTVIAIDEWGSDMPKWLKITLPIATATAAGLFKEYAMDAHSAGHEVDIRDARATIAGGLVVSVAWGWKW